MKHVSSRFISCLIIVSALLFMAGSCNRSSSNNLSHEPAREAGQTDVLGLACDPIPTVRVAIIGLGMRGSEAVRRFMYLEGVEIKVLCDLEQANIDGAKKILADSARPEAEIYKGADDWKKICERKDIDLVYVCTHWALHTPIAVYAMEHGKHVAIEVPAALTIDDCWKLVNTAEKTRRHCMQLENCCYDFFEMATLNMAQKGLFGEIVHVEGAYIHDLRSLNFAQRDSGGYYDYWRLKHNEIHTGNPYPTHGLGPISQILNIHRGDKMEYLVSLSSNQYGMTAYAKKEFGDNAPMAQKDYALGDMNTTLIKTHNGKSILIQHDVTSPRPYSRIHMVSGTQGFALKYPKQGLAFEPNAHHWLGEKALDSMLKTYEHPITKEVGEKARQVGGHGGMDFIMDYRLIYCLRNGLPLDQDVYDAAEWCSLIPLSEASVREGSKPMKMPDFTRGAWNKIKGYSHAYLKNNTPK